MELPPVTKRIVCISGFRQSRHEVSGIGRLHAKLEHQHRDDNQCRVTRHDWRDDWPEFVQLILETGPSDPREIDVRIVAYSWGVGYGAIKLAKLLRREDITVRRLASCDGVFHQWRQLHRALWHSEWLVRLGLSSPPRIIVPDNVRRVDYLRQAKNRPRGHELIADVPLHTEIHDHGFLEGRTHEDIDSSIEFERLALEACE